MKILMVCSKAPFPPRDGGALAMLNLARSFHHAGIDLTILAMNTPKHYVNPNDIPDYVRQIANFHLVDVNTDVKVADVLANFIFSRKSYHVQRFTSKRFAQELERLLQNEKYDVVQLETLYMTAYAELVKANSDALISYRAHNIEFEIWNRRAENEYNPLKKYLFAETAYRIKAYEEETLQKKNFDLLIPITDRDKGTLQKMGADQPHFVAPVGMDLNTLESKTVEMEYPSICYIGAMDWIPNQEGIDWFLGKVWPLLRKKFPEVQFYLAGRNMPRKYLNLKKKNVQVLGEVADAGEFLMSKGVFVVPILSGSGMRVKVVEGMAYGKSIVATSVAVEGIKVSDGDHVMVADTPEDFTERIAILLEQRPLFDIMGKKAREFVSQNLDNNVVGKKLVEFYQGQRKRKKEGK